MSLTKTAEAVKYFEFAIEEMKEALYQKIEQDEEYLAFKQKFFGKYASTFIYYRNSMEFAFYGMKEGCNTFLTFFTITNAGEIKFNADNTFEGIENVAKEAQKIVSKFL